MCGVDACLSARPHKIGCRLPEMRQRSGFNREIRYIPYCQIDENAKAKKRIQIHPKRTKKAARGRKRQKSTLEIDYMHK